VLMTGTYLVNDFSQDSVKNCDCRSFNGWRQFKSCF
jgi:hypothetical protein